MQPSVGSADPTETMPHCRSLAGVPERLTFEPASSVVTGNHWALLISIHDTCVFVTTEPETDYLAHFADRLIQRIRLYLGTRIHT